MKKQVMHFWLSYPNELLSSYCFKVVIGFFMFLFKKEE